MGDHLIGVAIVEAEIEVDLALKKVDIPEEQYKIQQDHQVLRNSPQALNGQVGKKQMKESTIENDIY